MSANREESSSTRALVRILLIAGVLSGIGLATIPMDRHGAETRPVPAPVAAASADPRILPGANAPLAVREGSGPEEPAPTF